MRTFIENAFEKQKPLVFWDGSVSWTLEYSANSYIWQNTKMKFDDPFWAINQTKSGTLEII